jgi:FAD/FMN-containing dehydrogenase
MSQSVDVRTIIEALAPKVSGPIFKQGDAGYDESRSVWNAMIDRRPAVILQCKTTADIVAAVNVARDRGLPLSIKGGGHNIAGLAVVDDGLMLDMSSMRQVTVDTARRVARVEPGCTLGDVDTATQAHGLAAVLGFVSATGCAGLTLGGGFGYLSRRFGWTTDNVVGFDVVTADGKFVRASADENPDLFWGLSGGGGNFGVVTAFDYVLHPVGPQIVGGAIAWRGEEAASVLALHREIVRTAPRELTCVAALRLAPPAPWILPEAHGKPIVALFVCYTGPLEDAERVLAPIKTFGTPVGSTVQPRTYVSQQALLDATQPKGRRYYWKSEYLKAIDEPLAEAAIAQAARLISPHSAIILFPFDGRTNEFPESHSAVGNRDAKAVINIASAWDRPEDDAANVAWARTAWEDLRRFSTGGTYINFLTADEGEDRTRAAYRGNYARLAEIKRVWDPSNMFRANKNVRPS